LRVVAAAASAADCGGSCVKTTCHACGACWVALRAWQAGNVRPRRRLGAGEGGSAWWGEGDSARARRPGNTCMRRRLGAGVGGSARADEDGSARADEDGSVRARAALRGRGGPGTPAYVSCCTLHACCCGGPAARKASTDGTSICCEEGLPPHPPIPSADVRGPACNSAG